MSETIGIPVGSGYVYEMPFTGTIPADTDIEKEANRLGYIEKGATLTYKPTYKTFSDDMGQVRRSKLTAEEATFKFGLISWAYGKLDALCSTCRITERSGGRTIKIGGIANDDAKRHLIRFFHPDNELGDLRITIVGTNTGGFALKYAPDDSTDVEPEITATPADGEGTLILIDETDPGVLGALTVTSVAGTTSGKTALTVTPPLTNGNSYKYKTASTVTLPAFGDSTSTGYTTWDGTSEISATTGNEILVVEVDSTGAVKKAGKASVTAKV